MQKKVELAEQLRFAREIGGAFLLPDRLLLRISGVDAFRYLNGQITRDLSRAVPGHALSACILTPKGKLCAPLLIWRENSDLLVESDPSLEEPLIARLERYIVADDALVSKEFPSQQIHIFGNMAESEPWISLIGNRANRLGVTGIDVTEDAPGVSSLPLLDTRVVESLRIERKIPIWGAELSEDTLPPEAGLDSTHIDYDRGCYPGQEVISRLKSIGRVNRLLYLVTAPGGRLVAGQEVILDGGMRVGSITSVTPLIQGEPQRALAYLQRNAIETGAPLFVSDPLTQGATPLSIIQVTGP